MTGILRGASPVGVRFGRIERLDEHAVVPARVPDETGRGRPGHVSHILGAEMPCERRSWPGGAREALSRSEERRVGKECRFRWALDHERIKTSVSARVVL